MARYTGPVCRFCRREGCKLFLKGDRCYTDKCAFARRPAAPGQHGTSRKKVSQYGLQLREKQKVKRAYGMQEKQFRSYFALAAKQHGVTGAYMLSLLERRLDNVVYRLGIGESRAQARQFVMHGHITVNGKRCDIPSALVNVNDVIAVSEKARGNAFFKELAESNNTLSTPAWITAGSDSFSGTVTRFPAPEDFADIPVESQAIVELYSK